MNQCTAGNRALFGYCRYESCGVHCIAIGVDHPKLREQAMKLVNKYFPSRGVLAGCPYIDIKAYFIKSPHWRYLIHLNASDTLYIV